MPDEQRASPAVSPPRVSLEYRRFLLLRLAYPELDVPAPPLIDSYWRLHAADQPRFVVDCESLTWGTEVSPDELVPPPRHSARAVGPEIWDHASPGPLLRNLHWDSTIPRLIAEQTGAIVAPCAVGYLYCGSGGFIGIHTDQYGNELTLLTLLSGSVEQLDLHLHLVDTPLAEIQNLAEATDGLPEGGTSFDIDTVPFLFSGQRIPHHRAPLDREAETVVLAQSYADLLPAPPRLTSRPTDMSGEEPCDSRRGGDLLT